MRKVKIFVLSACFLLLFSLCAAGEQTDIQISSVQAKAGESVNIGVTLTQPVEIKSLYFAVECENKSLLPSAAKWQITGALLKDWDNVAADGVVAFSAVKAVQGEIIQLTVDIPADIKSGEYVIHGICTAQGEDGITVTMQVADGMLDVVDVEVATVENREEKSDAVDSEHTFLSATEITELRTTDTIYVQTSVNMITSSSVSTSVSKENKSGQIVDDETMTVIDKFTVDTNSFMTESEKIQEQSTPARLNLLPAVAFFVVAFVVAFAMRRKKVLD